MPLLQGAIQGVLLLFMSWQLWRHIFLTAWQLLLLVGVIHLQREEGATSGCNQHWGYAKVAASCYVTAVCIHIIWV
jgi:hypothetical protein